MSARLGGAAARMVRYARVARLATLLPDGAPHVVPVSPAVDGDTIVFASDDSAKLRNVRRDPRVALVVDDYVEDWDALRRVALFGRATVVEEGPAWERGRDLLYAKYAQYETESPILPGETAVVRIDVERVSTLGA